MYVGEVVAPLLLILELQGFYRASALAIALLGAGRFSAGGVHGRWN